VTQDNPAVPGGFAPGSRVAGYLLEEQIGQGGMAVVFRAHDERLDRTVALKILAPALAADEAFRQRFIRESRAAAAVDDPHIIPVFEAGESGGVLFIAMRYVRGGDVRSMVGELGPLPPGRVAEIVSQVASALDAAHGRGLVHRDVKPANMLLDSRATIGRPDHIYLSDFGLSKAALQATGLTGTGTFLGTLDYIAPEQIEGKPVDGRADQYALACAAFELVTGRPPFQRDDAMAIMYAQLSEPPPPVTARRPELSFAVDDVFRRALAKAPSDRFASCTEFAEALRDAMGIRPYDSGPGSVPSGPHPGTQVVGGYFGAGSGSDGPGQSGSGPGGSGPGGPSGYPGTEAVNSGGPPTQLAGSGGHRDTSPDLTGPHWQGGPGGPGYGAPGYGGGPGYGGPGYSGGPDQGGGQRRPWWRSPGAIAALIVLIVLAAGGGGYAALHKSNHTTVNTKPLALPGCSSAAATAPTLKVPNSKTPIPSNLNPFGVIGSPDGKFVFAVTPTQLEVYGLGPGTTLTHKFTYTIANRAATGITLTKDGKDLLVAAQNSILVLSVAEAEEGASSINVGTLTVPGLTGNGQAVEVLVSKQGKYAFLTLKAANQVAVFNLQQALSSSGFDSNAYVGSIKVTDNPVGMALSSQGGKLYVTSYGPDTAQPVANGSISILNVIKAETKTSTALIGRVTGLCEPSRMVTDGNTLWVTARGSNELLGFAIDKLLTTPKKALISKVKVGQTPIGMLLVNGGSRLVIADTDVNKTGGKADNLAVVNVAAALAGKSALLGYIPSGELPRELAVVPGGRVLLVSDNGSAQVQTVDLSKLP
jgi:serine/threonine protein kinase